MTSLLRAKAFKWKFFLNQEKSKYPSVMGSTLLGLIDIFLVLNLFSGVAMLNLGCWVENTLVGSFEESPVISSYFILNFELGSLTFVKKPKINECTLCFNLDAYTLDLTGTQLSLFALKKPLALLTQLSKRLKLNHS